MPEYHYRWEWRLRSSPERLWLLAADTNRFNRDAGVPELELGSSAVTADPEVADLLGGGLNAAPIEATLKGFEDERFEIWSVD